MTRISMVKPLAADESRYPWMGRPILWAVWFVVLDLIWVLGLHAVAWNRGPKGTILDGEHLDIAALAMKLWNTLHVPVRWLVEPILFPVVTSHPQSPSDIVFFAYEALCILQSALVGYALCILIRWVMQQIPPMSD